MTTPDSDPPDLIAAARGRNFPFTVNGRPFSIDDDDPSGRDLRAAARLDPASAWILIQIRDRGATSLGLDDKITLRKGETAVFRAFESDRLFSFTLVERGWEWGAETILESELRQYGEVPDDYDIVQDKAHDEVIERGSAISLTDKGAEQFITRPTPPREVTIRVNGRKRTVPAGLITYETVVGLAFPDAVPNPDVIYTVGFRHGGAAHPEGSLVAGQSVEVREGMIFVATPTNRS
ncbi:multiubiquitin domain-containing protein [uncultured Brevundimonas sp.]|uniref:multiubiquitin domain-containing protein n=1 Tax=uncultured Brevundimonas sp. TaxID=213418 RepID=UPI0030EE46A0|tara:strand:+ start:5601 stop:6308 length:708 start_codon:yes stop_codon:yes gene_type:complete